MKIRLNKYLSRSGIASRREADRMIEMGRVEVNGKVVSILGSKIDPDRDQVSVDGKRIKNDSPLICLMVNKPSGYVVSMRDPFHQNTIMNLLPDLKARVFPVGRLDKDSEGLLLMTNDGELANRLMHPRYEIKKEYLVEIDGRLSPSDRERMEKGIVLEGKVTAPAAVSVLSASPRTSLLKIELREGRKREIRRMLTSVGHSVHSLKRVRYAGLSLKGLKKGAWRYLTGSEYKRLRKGVGL